MFYQGLFDAPAAFADVLYEDLAIAWDGIAPKLSYEDRELDVTAADRQVACPVSALLLGPSR